MSTPRGYKKMMCYKQETMFVPERVKDNCNDECKTYNCINCDKEFCRTHDSRTCAKCNRIYCKVCAPKHPKCNCSMCKNHKVNSSKCEICDRVFCELHKKLRQYCVVCKLHHCPCVRHPCLICYNSSTTKCSCGKTYCEKHTPCKDCQPKIMTKEYNDGTGYVGMYAPERTISSVDVMKSSIEFELAIKEWESKAWRSRNVEIDSPRKSHKNIPEVTSISTINHHDICVMNQERMVLVVYIMVILISVCFMIFC